MITENRIEALESSVRRIRRLNHWLSVAVLLLLAAIIGGFTQEAANSKTIRSTSFVVVDENGVTRATLAIDGRGPTLTMLDDKGEKPRLEMYVFQNRPSLIMTGSDGVSHCYVQLTENDPSLILADKNGKSCSMSINESGPAISLYDTNGGTPRCMLYVDKDRGPRLNLLTPDALPLWSAP